jgi:lauroyl/myristoyl acyltransferase
MRLLPKCLLNRFMRSRPPDLPDPYSMRDFGIFLRSELGLMSANYVRSVVNIEGAAHLPETGSGAVVTFLHYGDWILAGAAIHHLLDNPYTAIASRRNLDLMSSDEHAFWTRAHQRINALYSRSMFYTDESPRLPISWLRSGKLLGVLLDVREGGQRYVEEPFAFLGRTIYMQTGAARLAKVANVPLIPASIRFQPSSRRHQLRLFPALKPTEDLCATTQKALDCLAFDVELDPNQQFHDIGLEFSTPESRQI